MDDGATRVDPIQCGFVVVHGVQVGLYEGAKNREGQGVEDLQCRGVSRLAPDRGLPGRKVAAAGPARVTARFESEDVGVQGPREPSRRVSGAEKAGGMLRLTKRREVSGGLDLFGPEAV